MYLLYSHLKSSIERFSENLHKKFKLQCYTLFCRLWKVYLHTLFDYNASVYSLFTKRNEMYFKLFKMYFQPSYLIRIFVYFCVEFKCSRCLR
jgi:hypothetical protein